LGAGGELRAAAVDAARTRVYVLRSGSPSEYHGDPPNGAIDRSVVTALDAVRGRKLRGKVPIAGAGVAWVLAAAPDGRRLYLGTSSGVFRVSTLPSWR
jgi:hypothetical protein